MSLTTWDTGTPPNPLIHNIGNARVTAFEQNAIWTAHAAAPTLTPVMLGVLGILLLLAGLRLRRRA